MTRVEPKTLRRNLLEDLKADPSGVRWCRDYTEFIDSVVREVCETAWAVHKPAPLSIVATGGYGRRELSPWSDIDLTVVPSDEAAVSTDSFVRELFLLLQDHVRGALGIEIGYSLRFINDAPALDGASRTALLDARLIAGSSHPLDNLMTTFWDSFPVGDFLLEKVTERDQALRKFNDTPLVVEPHVKQGAGGLRCLHTANWIKTALGDRPVQLPVSFERMLKARNLLHLVSGRSNDLLTRQRQAEIADLLKSDPFTFMAELAEAGLALHGEYQRSLDRIKESRFVIEGGILARHGEVRATGLPDAGEAASGVATATQLGLEVSDLALPISTDTDGARAMYAVGTGERTIRNLDRCGVLDTLLPELTACRTLMPRDSAHSFTVFEHTMRAVRNLDRASETPFFSDLMSSLPEQSILYLAVLLHDVGKINTDRRHSQYGADLAQEVCRRWDLAPAASERVVWLVREHLTMARFVSMRDVAKPQTAKDLAAIVGDQEALAMLTLLTWADISAVSADAWTPMQEGFIKELYAKTLTLMTAGEQDEVDPVVLRRRLLRSLRGEAKDETQTEAFLASLPTDYLVSTPSESVRVHQEYERRARLGQPTVEVLPLPETASSEVTVVALDQKGLLSKILGVIYALDLSVHAIRAATTTNEAPVAIDSFRVSFGENPVPRGAASLLTTHLLSVLRGQSTVEELLQQRGKDPDRAQQVFTFTLVEGKPSILEIQAPRGRGMAYRFSRVLARHGWNITAAKVGQWAGRGAAAFYLTDENGETLRLPDVEQALGVKV